MKQALALIAILLILAGTASPDPWGGRQITVTAGTAIRVVNVRTMVSSFFVQAHSAGSGRIYVLYAPTNLTCTNGSAGTTLIAELSAATANAPGGNITIPSNPDPIGGFDLAGFCIDGTNSGDVVTTSWNQR